MNNFLRSGRDMAVGQNGVRPVADDKELSSRPLNPNNRQLQPLGRPRSDEDRGSLRTTFGQASHLVRPMFGKCLSIVYLFSIDSLSILYVFLRERIEKHKGEDREIPKLVRCSREADAKESQKITEKGERRTQPTPTHDLARTCLYTGYEQEIPKRETRITLERTKDKTRNAQETPKRKTRIRQESRNYTTKNTPERYCKGTGKVLNSGGKGTGEVLESYQRNTKEVLTASRSGVALERDGGKSARHCAAFRPVGNRNEMERSNLKGLMVDNLLSRLLRQASRSNFPIFGTSRTQRYDGIKGPMVYSLQLIILFCVLFSRSTNSGAGVLAHPLFLKGGVKNVFLWIKYTFILLLFAGVNMKANAQFYKPSALTIRKGEHLPEAVMQRNLHVIHMKTGKVAAFKLDDYKDKLVILDFWASWCGPCRASLMKMDSLMARVDTAQVLVLAVNYEPLEKVENVQKVLQFNFSSVYSDTLLSKIFPHQGIPHMVWIKNGKVLGLPKHEHVDQSVIERALAMGDIDIPENLDDRILDPEKQLFVAENGSAPLLYHKDRLQAYAANPLFVYEPLRRIETKDSVIYYANNISIPRLIHSIYKEELFVSFRRYPSSFMQYQSKADSLALTQLPAVGIKLSCAKELLLKEDESAWLRSGIRSFLSGYLQLQTQVEHVTWEHYAVLSAIAPTDKIENILLSRTDRSGVVQQGKDKQYSALPFGVHFINALEARLSKCKNIGLTVPVLVNRSGIDDKLLVDFKLPVEIESIDQLNKHIHKYGLKLKVEEGWADKVAVQFKKGGDDV